MCLVPTCVAMVIGGDLYSRVWQWLLDVVIAHLYVGSSPISWMPRCSTASWIFFLPKCVAMEIGCDWYPRIWLWQLGVVGFPRVWRWQLDAVGGHEFGGPNWIRFVTACAAVEVGCP